MCVFAQALALVYFLIDVPETVFLKDKLTSILSGLKLLLSDLTLMLKYESYQISCLNSFSRNIQM